MEMNNGSKITFTPKVADFEKKNNFLKLLISSKLMVEGRSLICGGRD